MATFRFQELKTAHPHPLPNRERVGVRGGALRSALYALSILLILGFLPGAVCAQGVFQGFSGLLEFDYTVFSSKTTDASGATTKFSTNTYDPRVTLSVNTDIFPKLNLNAGAMFEKNISTLSSEGQKTNTTLTRWTPYIYLTLKDPLYEIGIGYNRKEDSTKVTETPRFTLINDDYLVTLKWRPDGFPSTEAQLERTNTYDDSRTIQNTTKDYVSLLSRYQYGGLDVRYQGTYTDTNDKVGQVDTKDLLNSGWVSYANSFFDRRVSVSSTYNVNYEVIKTSISAPAGGGTVALQLFPLAGLSINNNTVTPLTLNANPALIDGNLAASAGINLGLPPLGGDTTARNMGLDFFLPTEVNQLLLWIDRDLSSAPAIVSFFTSNIQVFSSSDNLNWTPVPLALPPITFGPFQNRFVINFTNVTTRFIKVVTPPLNAAVLGASSFPNIFVTELQAFLTQPVGGTPGKKSLTTTRTTNNYYFDSRTRILDIPTLFYELDYFYTRIDPGGQLMYTLSNGFSGNYRFSQVLSGRARVAYEDGEEEKEHRTAWIYNAALEATPLRTLTDRLVFSGRDETIGGKRDSNNSIILYNIAQLYKGFDVNLNIGQNFTRDQSGLKTNQTDFEILTTIIPHPAVNLTLDYKYSIIDQSGGTSSSGSGNMQTGEFIVSYRPFATLFAVAKVDLSTTTAGKTLVTQNYGFNWSPFPDGALQFRFFYNENLSTGGIKERIINPGVRWNITKRSYLDLSYQRNLNTSPGQKVDESIISLQAKIFL
jgi:hypothetical protein